MSQIVLQRFANREIRIGAQSIAIVPKNYGDKKADVEKSRFDQALHDLWVSGQNVKEGFAAGCDCRGAFKAIPWGVEQHEAQKSRLDIISEFQEKSNQPKKKGGWGFKPRKTTFGRNARHRILEAGAVMDGLHGKNVVEVTLTVPGNTRQIFRTIADWSGWIMNRVTQVVRDFDKDCAWFYVWENQVRGALHLHFAIGSSDLHDVLNVAEKIKCKWFKCLLELQEKANVDVFKTSYGWTWRYKPEKWQYHILPVYKSVAAYFSKYLGKQSGKDAGNNNGFCPARWWGSSKSIKQGIEDARTKISIEISLPNVEEAITFLRNFIHLSSPIRQYKYDFDLGTSKSGTELGGGWREVYYFDDVEFANISEYINVLGEYVTQTWGVYADIPLMSAQTSTQTSILGETQT